MARSDLREKPGAIINSVFCLEFTFEGTWVYHKFLKKEERTLLPLLKKNSQIALIEFD